MLKRQQWEYRISETHEGMEELGSEGWELVAVTVLDGRERFYFKRPAPSMSERITLEQRDRVLSAGKEEEL